MAVPTNSHLNDLMLAYYGPLFERDGDIFGPVQIATDLVDLNDEAVYTIPYPEKTKRYFFWFECQGLISAGTVSLYMAHSAGFTGNWQLFVNRNMSPAQTDSTLRLYGPSTAYGPILATKAVVTAAIVGGTVNMWLSGTWVD